MSGRPPLSSPFGRRTWVAALVLAAALTPVAVQAAPSRVAVAAPQAGPAADGCSIRLGLALNAAGAAGRSAVFHAPARLDAAALSGDAPRLAGVSILNPDLKPVDDAPQVRLSALEIPDGRRLAVMFDLVCADGADVLGLDDGPALGGRAWTLAPSGEGVAAFDPAPRLTTLAAYGGGDDRGSAAMASPAGRVAAGGVDGLDEIIVLPDVDTLGAMGSAYFPPDYNSGGFANGGTGLHGLGGVGDPMLAPPAAPRRGQDAAQPDPAVPTAPSLLPAPVDPGPAPTSLAGPVPEPSSWSMLVLGLGGLGALIRRERGRREKGRRERWSGDQERRGWAHPASAI